MIHFFTDATSPPNRYARNTDPLASHQAASNARGTMACQQRIAITAAVQSFDGGLNYKEISEVTGINSIAVARRVGECGLIYRDTPLRDGCGVWFKQE